LEQCDIIRIDVHIIAVHCQASSGFRYHVDCTDGAKAVDVDIAQCSFQINHVDLTVFGAATCVARFGRSAKISYLLEETLTATVIVEEGIMSRAIN
jgi:hypothetical protein